MSVPVLQVKLQFEIFAEELYKSLVSSHSRILDNELYKSLLESSLSKILRIRALQVKNANKLKHQVKNSSVRVLLVSSHSRILDYELYKSFGLSGESSILAPVLLSSTKLKLLCFS